MYLKRLELQGFKSFADKTTLDFMKGITAVIGPNGSGKSNISDSIRWVLGEQSIKSLRGAKSEDIIFAGTQSRKSLGFAEASIVIDNSDGRLPIEFSEVTVTRRIYRSGESGYYINKTACRLKDVIELFMDTGIGKDGYSIIGQGKIDEILSNKSEDRRHIFEEAAGIVKYRARKEESEKKLEHAKLNLLRISDILSEIESNIEPLKTQSDKAKKFLGLREELKNIEVGLFLYNIENYKEKLKQIADDEEIMQLTYKKEQENQKTVNDLKEKLKIELDDITKQIEDIQNIGFESSNQIEKLNSEISVNNERIANNKTNYTRYEKEIEEDNKKIEQLKEEKEQKLKKKENLFSNKEKFTKELEEKKNELNNLTKNLSKKELEIENKKSTVEQDIDKKYEIQNEINTQDITYDNLCKREKTLKSEITIAISELDSARMKKSDISQSFSQIESKRNLVNKSLEEIEIQKKESNEKIKEYDRQINSITDEIRMKDSRRKFLVETEKEKEGYVKSVKSLLKDCEKIKELGKGMYGVLANIINAPKEYETAIEMCLGAGLQNIVTQSEEDAKRLVEYLRKNNLGRASFLPITSVRGKKIDKYDSRGIKGVIGIAADLVKYDNKYEGIIFSLLGKTIIVEDMDSGVALAKRNKYSFKIVTIKGDVINASGAITGGSVAQRTVNILGRSREIEDLQKEIENLNKKLEKITNEKQEYINNIEDVLEETDLLEKQLQDIEIVYATEKQKVILVEEQSKKLEIRLEKLRQEENNIGIQKGQAINIKEEKQKEIEILAKEISGLNLEIEQFAKSNKDNQKYIDDLNFDITNLKISVSSFEESESSIEEISKRIEQDIENFKLGIKNKEKEKENIIKENENLKNSIDEINSKIEDIKENVLNSGNKVEELKSLRIDKNNKLSETEKEIENEFHKIEDIKEQIVKIDVKKTKYEQDLQDIINKMWEEYEITPNNAQGYKKPENIAHTQKAVNSIRNEIKDLGSINIDSIEEYKQTRERYDFMCEQRLDLENSISKLRKVITDMTETMRKQFRDKFKLINKNFNEVFRELFGGGKAELILADESNILECGIEIRVQPPGKKLQNMTLLSGGEKAFTAIAILFAILKINPAPFCVLDEIEAALDDVNVFRYAEYLRKFANDTQFLVITHRKGTMEAADTVYGVTMEESGISKLLSMKLK